MLTNSNQSPKIPQQDEPDLSELEKVLQESKGIKKRLGEVNEEIYIFCANESNRRAIIDKMLEMMQKTDGEASTKEKVALIVDEMQILSRMVLAEFRELREKNKSFRQK